MRIIRLVSDNSTIGDFDSAVETFLGREPIGKFPFTRDFDKDSLHPGEWLAFIFRTEVVYVAKAETGLVLDEHGKEVLDGEGQKYFCVDVGSLTKGNGQSIHELEHQLNNIGWKNTISNPNNRAWDIIGISDADAKNLLEGFVIGEITEDEDESDEENQSAQNRTTVNVSRIERDPKLAGIIKRLNRRCCQICGNPIILPGKKRYVEAHHIKPLSENGPDKIANMICVCPNCHIRLQYHAIKLTGNIKSSAHKIGQIFIDYHDNLVIEE